VEYQALGETTKAFANGGDEAKIVGTIGVSFSY